MAIFVLKDKQGKDLPVRTALEGSFVLREITPQNEGEIKGALLAHGAENFAEAARLKRQNGALAVFGLREYPAGHDFLAAIERSYADLLENRFALRSQQQLDFPMRLEQQALRQLLLMTPYAWRAKQDRRIALESREVFETRASFTLTLMQRLA